MSSDLHHLAAAYALDALDSTERREFEAHYPSCEICAAEVADFREVAASLAASTATEAPASLRDRVLGEITQTRQVSPLEDSTPEISAAAGPALRRRAALAVAAAMLLIAGTVAVTRQDSTATTDVVLAPDAVVTNLESLDGLDGVVQVVWSREQGKVVVVGTGLAELAADRAYSLWFVRGTEVEAAGLFRPVDGAITTVLDVADTGTTGWGITIEPSSGSEQPTTPVIFSGDSAD